MDFDLTQIAVILIGLAAAAITTFVIPWLKAKLGADKFNQLLFFAQVAVAAAEQLAKQMDFKAEDKLLYALREVQKMAKQHGISFDETTIVAAIEAAVKEMKDAGTEIKAV